MAKEDAQARLPYEDDIIFSWHELHRGARYLCETLAQWLTLSSKMVLQAMKSPR